MGIHRVNARHGAPYRQRRLALAIVAGAMVALALAPLTAAKSPGANGPIVFTRYSGDDFTPYIWRVEADGSNAHQLPLPWSADGAAWSPDGSRIVATFFDEDTLRPATFDPEGGNIQILEVPQAPRDLALLCHAWSPNGQRLACQGDSFSAEHPETNGIYTMRADGSDLRRLTFDANPPIFTAGGTCGGGDVPATTRPTAHASCSCAPSAGLAPCRTGTRPPRST